MIRAHTIGVRLDGDASDVAAFADQIAALPGVSITRRSGPYPNRTNPRVRLYLDITPARL